MEIDTDDYRPPDPLELKSFGNAKFQEGLYEAAIELWKSALKTALKQSVRNPSSDLVILQRQLRSNIALALAKIEDWVLAKEYLMVVYEQDPNSLKIIYNLARVHIGLHDEDKALDLVKGGLKLHPGDPALRSLEREITLIKLKGSRIKPDVDITALDEERSLETTKPPDFEKELFNPLLTQESSEAAPKADEGGRKLLRKGLREMLISWKHSRTELDKGETQCDLDDWQNSDAWNKAWDSERLNDEKTVLYMTLPLSILAACENCIEYLNKRDMVGCYKLPVLSTACSEPPSRLTPWMTELLTRRSKRPFTIHVVGARGDVEMEAKWSGMLERLPHLTTLQVIMIGFVDKDDTYSTKLGQGEFLSPPLTRKAGLKTYQKFVARVYKGLYHDFLKSAMVKRETKTEHLKALDVPVEGLTAPMMLSPMLCHETHPFYPDLIVLPEPNLSRHFDTLMPTISQLLVANIPLLFLGYSALEVPSHEAITMPAVLRHLNAKIVMGPYWNPFGVPFKVSDDMPSMPMKMMNGETLDYRGWSSKYAVVCMVQGCIDQSTIPQLAQLTHDKDYIRSMRRQLVDEKDIDVESEYLARQSYDNDSTVQANLEAGRKLREELIDRRAESMARTLSEKLNRN